MLCMTAAAADAYQIQRVFELAGPLDDHALETAAAAMHFNATPIYRAGFIHQDLKEPVQVIPRDVILPAGNTSTYQIGKNSVVRRRCVRS